MMQEAVEVGILERYGYLVSLTHNADLSAQWKFLGRGGAVKIHEYPCHCCAIHNKELVEPNNQPCRLCIRIGHTERDPNWKCYHREMLTERKITELEQEASHLLRTDVQQKSREAFDSVRENSNLRMNENPRVCIGESKLDSKSIHYDISRPLDREAPDYGVRYDERMDYTLALGEDLKVAD